MTLKKASLIGLLAAVAFAIPASAQTIEDLQAQINALLAQLAALQGGSGSVGSGCYGFTADLTIGSQNAEVTALQQYLQGTGHFTFSGGATGYFGPITQSAVAAWQAGNGVAPPAGYWGPISRAKYNSMCAVAMPGGDSGSDSGSSDDFFSGSDEGYLDDFDQLSKYSTEEVGEGQEDVSVLGIEFEAQDADQMVERVTVVVDTPTGEDDLEDLIEDVSVWLDGEEIGRMEVDDASHDASADEYTFRFVGLTGIVEEGDVAELIVAVSGVNNIDSGDAGDGWTIEIPADGIRASSPNGVTETYDTGLYDETFTVDTFAGANDVELSASKSDDSPEAGVVNVSATSDTDSVELLRFELEADGSDFNVTEIPITLTVTGVADIDLIVNRLTLEVDGVEYSETVSTATLTAASIIFDDLDIDIDDGDSLEFVVTADINDLEGTFGDGDTLKAELTATNMDYIEAEDESGEDLTDADATGTALGDEQAFYDVGIFVSLVDVESSVSADDGADNDTGTFKVVFEVEAFDGTVYIADTAIATTAASIVGSDYDNIIYLIEESGTATVDLLASGVTFTTSGGAEASTGGLIELEDGESAEITLTVTRTNNGGPDGDGLYRMLLKSISWNDTDDAVSTNNYNFDLEDYKTGLVSLN